jgi:CheY-like chemotaxis protein
MSHYQSPQSQVKEVLSDTHVLIVDDEEENREMLSNMFKTLGATTWPCDSQLCAIGRYFKLYKQRLKPRVVISDWWLSEAGSDEYKVLEQSNSLERHGTCSMLFENIHKLDPSVFTCVYTRDVPGAKLGLMKLKLGHVEIFSKLELSPAAFAKKIATHKGISRQRVMASSIIEMAMEAVQSETRTRIRTLK